MSDTFIPIGREETYLAKIAGYDVTLPPHPISREEHYLAKIAGEDVELPYAPISRDEHYLAKTAGQDVELPPYPISRDEFYLAKMAGEDVPLPPNPTSRISELLDEIAEEEPTPVVTLKTFDEATEEELVAMVQAADDGLIDLYEDAGWRVGQERQAQISTISSYGYYDGVNWFVGEQQNSQNLTLVLIHRGEVELQTPVKAKDGSTRTTCSFVVGVKNSLETMGYLKETASNTGSWPACDRRNWCLAGFRKSLSDVIRPIFKKFKCVTGSYNATSTGGDNVIDYSYFSLLAEKEVFGTRSGSTDKESSALVQFEWYQNSSNREKRLTDSGQTAKTWWLRSPQYNSSTFCAVKPDGQVSHYSATNTYGISPFGCV